MKPELLAYTVVFSALIGTPVLAGLFWFVLRRVPAAGRTGLMVLALLPVLGTLLLRIGGWWLWSFQATLLLLALAYAALGLLTALALRLPRPGGLWLGGGLALLLAGGLFVGGIGAPLVMFVVGEWVPMHVGQPVPGLSCHVTPFGNSQAYGYHVRLRAPLAALPLLERPVLDYDVPAAGQMTPDAACAQVAADLAAASGR